MHTFPNSVALADRNNWSQHTFSLNWEETPSCFQHRTSVNWSYVAREKSVFLRLDFQSSLRACHSLWPFPPALCFVTRISLGGSLMDGAVSFFFNFNFLLLFNYSCVCLHGVTHSSGCSVDTRVLVRTRWLQSAISSTFSTVNIWDQEWSKSPRTHWTDSACLGPKPIQLTRPPSKETESTFSWRFVKRAKQLRLFSLLALPAHISLRAAPHLLSLRNKGGSFFDSLIPIQLTEIEVVSERAKTQKDILRPSPARPPVVGNKELRWK